MNISVLLEKRRLIIQAGGWSLIDIDILTPLRATPVRTIPDIPGHDPHSTTGGQVEQGGEPAPGFGFRGSTATVVCGMPSAEGMLCSFPPGIHSHGHSWQS